jgi:hypothetical protein
MNPITRHGEKSDTSPLIFRISILSSMVWNVTPRQGYLISGPAFTHQRLRDGLLRIGRLAQRLCHLPIFDNPQSLNLYSYALNNPVTLPDLDGHQMPLSNASPGNDQSAMCTPDMPDCDNHVKVDGVVTSNAAENRIVERGLGAQCPGAFARCAITGNNLMGSPENAATSTSKTVQTDNGGTVVVQVSMNAKWKDLGPFWRYIPDQPPGLNIWQCEGCPNRHAQASKTANVLAAATAAAPLAAFGAGEAAVALDPIVLNTGISLKYVLPATPLIVNAGLNPKAPGLGGIAVGRFALKAIWSGLVETHKAKTEDGWWQGLQD